MNCIRLRMNFMEINQIRVGFRVYLIISTCNVSHCIANCTDSVYISGRSNAQISHHNHTNIHSHFEEENNTKKRTLTQATAFISLCKRKIHWQLNSSTEHYHWTKLLAWLLSIFTFTHKHTYTHEVVRIVWLEMHFTQCHQTTTMTKKRTNRFSLPRNVRRYTYIIMTFLVSAQNLIPHFVP